MTKIWKSVCLTVILALVLSLGMVLLPAGEVRAQGADVFIDPTPKEVALLETFTVNVDIIPGEPLRGAQFDMSFDQSLLTCTGVTEGDLFNMGGAQTTSWQPPAIDNGAGTITGAACAITGAAVPVSNPGTFATVSFTAKGVPGTSVLDLSNVVVGDAAGLPVVVTVTDGQVIVYATPTVTSVSPDFGEQGKTLPGVVITGTEFYDTVATDVSFGAGITVTSFNVDSDTQITADITIAGGAALGTRDVSVTTPGGTGTLTDGFTVMAPSIEVWVDDDWNSQTDVDLFDPSLTWQYDAFATIEDGIDNVDSSTVNVLPGTYNENITIDEDLILQSTGGAAVTTIDGDGINDVVTVTLYDITISGFTITNGENGIGCTALDTSSIVIEDNIITGNMEDAIDFGIDVPNGSSVTIQDNDLSGNSAEGIDFDDIYGTVTIDGNTIEDNGTEGIYVNGVYSDDTLTITDNTISGNNDYGIYIYYVYEGSVTIDGNTITDNDDGGIYFYSYIESGSVIINGNTITGNGIVDGYGGIYFEDYIEYGATVVITDNTITGNYWVGIYVYDVYGDPTSTLTISGNTISDTELWGEGEGGIGIYLDYPDYESVIDIFDNTISGNADDGIYIYQVYDDTAEVNIYENTISDNDNDGVHIDTFYEDGEEDYDGSEVTVSSCNDIFGNSDYGVCNDSDYMVDATDNWWGDVSGPGGEGPGTGDDVSSDVDYEPWLLAPCGEEVVEEEEVEVAAGPSRFSHRYLNVSPVQTYPNQPVTISMVVANTGESRGSVQINLTINGTIEQSKRITINAGSSKRLEFTVMKWDAGTYDFYVGRLHGQFHIIATAAFAPPPPPPSPPTAIPDTTGQLGTGGIIAIVIIGIMVIGGLIVVFMMTRRA